MERKRIVILGAAGRDFHLFNTCFRGNESVEVVAFTATQIPFIDDRRYPAAIAGELYPDGIPIVPEEELKDLLAKEKIQEAIFAYSDVSYSYIEEKRKLVEAAGVAFSTFDVDATMIPSVKPVIAVCAVRTGCGKSQTTRKIAQLLQQQNKKVSVVRHPMPYGDLAEQRVQRFDTVADLDRHKCTIEEREEYEHHIKSGILVFAGVDFEAILREAEKEADVVLWDGGNNDTPFYKPDLWITVVDPLRPGHELEYFPGDVNFKRADVLLFNKMDEAKYRDVETIERHIAEHNPNAKQIKGDSVLNLEGEVDLAGKRVLVVEDGPTLTHGGMKIGAGTVAATRAKAKELIDPRPFLKGTLADTFVKYPEIGALLPAMGYGQQQMKDLEATIAACDCEAVVIGTPIDLGSLIKIDKPTVRVRYELEEPGEPILNGLVQDLINKKLG
ncbi:MAG: GTPase [Planctomycetota bacterium]|nr:MAG: GTPase [Planctomycetota bacterium]